MRLPVFGTIQNGAVLAARIGQRHPAVLTGFAIFFAAIWYDVDAVSAQSGDPPGSPLAILHLVASLILAIFVHREILVGPTTFRSLFSRPGFGRLGQYFINSMVIGAVLVGPALLPLFIGPLAWPAFADNEFLIYLSTVVVFLGSALTSTRLVLKLPACAINESWTWRQIWALGRGNTLRLLAVTFVAIALLSALSGLMTSTIAHASPVLAQLADGVVSAALTVLGTAWLSVSYLHLTVGNAAAADAGPRSERP